MANQNCIASGFRPQAFEKEWEQSINHRLSNSPLEHSIGRKLMRSDCQIAKADGNHTRRQVAIQEKSIGLHPDGPGAVAFYRLRHYNDRHIYAGNTDFIFF